LVHGADETARIEVASAALFGGGDLRDAGARTLDAALSTARPMLEVDALDASIVDLLVETGLVKSKGEARRAVAEGGAYLNNERVDDPDLVPGSADLIDERLLVLRRGKKSFAGVRVR
jgi:tyrosyl-tRNA synthetase